MQEYDIIVLGTGLKVRKCVFIINCLLYSEQLIIPSVVSIATELGYFEPQLLRDQMSD